LILGAQELRHTTVQENRPAGAAASFENLKILRIDYCDNDSCFLGELPRFVPHLQELEITGNTIKPTEILICWPTLTKLSVRSYCIQSESYIGPDRNFSSLQHLTLLTLNEKEAKTLISCCRSLRKLELITHSDFYVSNYRILTQMSDLEEVSLGLLGGHVPPEAATLLSERCSTTILLEDPQSASLYQHCPGVRVDTDGWLEMTKPGLSEMIAHNSSSTCYRKLISHKASKKSVEDTIHNRLAEGWKIFDDDD
jgi:hypothetical protein